MSSFIPEQNETILIFGFWVFFWTGRRGRDHMEVFTVHLVPITTKVVSVNPIHGDVICDQVCHWIVASYWFSLGTRVSSTKNTNRHNISEILFKVALNTITLPLKRKLKRKLCTDYEKKLLYSLKFARKMTCLSSLKGNNSVYNTYF